MDNNTVLVQVPLQTLYAEIKEIIRAELVAQKKEDVKDLLLSGAEACKLFQPIISKVTLTSWVDQGLIPAHRIGGRVYYKYSEIMDSVKTLKKYKKPVVTS